MAKKKISKEIILEKAKAIAINKVDGLASMREISNSLNVSPGTLYNYFDSQETLWCAIFNKMWSETKDSLNEILKKDISNDEKILKMLIIVSSDIESRNGYGYRLFQSFKTSPSSDFTELIDVRKLLKECFSTVITGTENQKSAKTNIIIALLLNGIIKDDDILLNDYISIIK